MIGANTLAFAGVLIVNFLANALPLNGKNTGELSNQYPNLFTPAGLTFSIWGVIYLWLIVFVAGNVYGFNEWGFDGILIATSAWLVGTYLINHFKLRSFHPITKFTFSAIDLIVTLCILAVLYGVLIVDVRSSLRRTPRPPQVPTQPSAPLQPD